MSETDLFGAYVRNRLEHWGREFALHRDCEYLGHVSKNMLQVLIDHKGDLPARPTGFKPLEVDREAMQVESIVHDMAAGGMRTEACVLRAYFCGMGRRKVERWETANLLLANAGLPMVKQRAYLTLVDLGVATVRGALWGMSRAAA